MVPVLRVLSLSPFQPKLRATFDLDKRFDSLFEISGSRSSRSTR